ncbi:MAG TPA: AMIN domain-containing protein [Candidatus Hydrothermia bacterium]|nr:AMIN domain-containing protein [Candidatus Hydrothermae bacterium]MDD3648886.1 AMIN domain-containing protein [Candidatus Hydrothermia bacterium]MDD5572744.1 AMIN domain-containing protein [Candidatus Hydrothermia bacterium]HOK23127.1 AMIN domain-containing protein [Candidatus Hydrothermia bacterium]HOL23831.1 AMIN domain-containing protein [Candidatus Hydrothermia bacterium]
MKKILLLLFATFCMFSMGVVEAQNTLRAYSIKETSEGTAIEFGFTGGMPEYRHFTLSNPPRIVIDLMNVIYGLDEKLIMVGKGGIERVRGSQFQRDPELIARIVLDVDGFRNYSIRQTDGKLTILVGGISGESYRSETEEPTGTRSAPSKASEKPKESTYKLDVGEKYFYSSRGKKDPFEPEVIEGEEELLNVSEAKLLGIIRSEEGNVALLQDRRGVGYVLKEGDKVRNGRVVRIESDRVVFATVDFGFTRRIELKLEEKEK